MEAAPLPSAPSWLHCLATACLGLFSALEEEAAFLCGPSGGSGLARAWPHDGFTDYDFLMWGPLGPEADSIPSGVCSVEALREGKFPHAGRPLVLGEAELGVGRCGRVCAHRSDCIRWWAPV